MRWAISILVAVGVVVAAWNEGKQLLAWFTREGAERAYYEGDIDGALSRYERVQQLQSREPRSYTDPADSILQFLGSEQGLSLTADAFDEMAAAAIRHYLAAIDHGPPSAWSYAGIGALAGVMRTARVRREGVDLSELSANPDELRPEDRLGEAAWVKAVQLEPHNYYYRDFLGDFYLRRGFEDRALAHFRVAVRLHPVLDRHYYLSYFASVSPAVLSAVELGIQDALESEETTVSEYDIHRFRAAIYLKLGRLEDARLSLEAAAEVAPQPHVVDVRIGEILAREGDDVGALAAFRRAAERRPDFYRSWMYLGLTYSRMERHEEAVEAALRARGLNPTHFTTSFATARVLRAANRLDEAAEALENVIRQHGERQQPYLQLIDLYEERSQLAQAARVARQLAARFPDEPIFKEQYEQLQQSVRPDR